MATKKTARKSASKKLVKAKKVGQVKPLVSLSYQKIEW